MRKWLLPESIEDVLPAEAARVEALRRVLLDHFRVRGYRLVQPPLVEFLDSLLTGTGRDLDLQTFKTVDPLSGRMLGVRADTTPQVARIDAHLLNEPGRHAPLLRGERAAHAGGGSRQHAAGRADRRRALRPRRHRRRPRDPRTPAVGPRRRRRPRPAPRPGPRRHLSRAGAGGGARRERRRQRRRALRGAARQGRGRGARPHGRACPSPRAARCARS